ncbi:dynamin family protein [Amycolatopsis regifaucium]|uniref:Isoniazid inducible protein IniA n=1 Tax=Amycolatopsis regifaucium TaxID=546365 RepID=A0A154M6Q8_9PSEU|nr:dynamin family protein [Amycolatopsis regifaucium]KZB80153.1 isoniazid inducible protein IniA [Amycolatopsis regifaucium]OKA09476.1 isoniazid inducible protein IniA [Amycolatopsis regifaucium]SFH62662.1 Dynamin family protein [Amycolatopsis regifaucium]
MTAPAWLDVLNETLDACVAHGRADLAERLRRRRDQQAPGTRIAVVGFPKQGKGYLLNALLNAPVCAVGDASTAAVPTEIGYASDPAATLVGHARERVPVGDLAKELEVRPPGSLRRVEVGLPRELLGTGLVLVDTPAVGDPRSPRTAATLDVLADAHAVILVSDATQELQPAELALARHIRTWCPALVLALTKIDVSPDWRELAARNRAALSETGVVADVFPVSATVRQAAAKAGDVDLNGRSGFPELLNWVGEQAARPIERTRALAAAVSVRAAAVELVETLQTRLNAVPQDSGIDQVTLLHQAQRRSEELRRQNVRWQNLLSDEITDLVSDAEYDLRERTRVIVRHIDRTFDEGDPVQIWPDFQAWLEENLAEAVETNYHWVADRATWIAHAVATSFGPRYGQVPDLPLTGSGVDSIPEVGAPKIERFKIGQKLFTGLRGSYGGVLMFGLVTSLAGLPLINPVSLGAGVAFATKSVRDEGGMRLQRRQALAKAAAQRHVDDVFIRFSKEIKDEIRQVQRRLRDHFAALSDELAEELTHRRELIVAGSAERDRRTQRVKKEIDRLAALHRKAGTLGVTARDIRELSA